MSQATEVHTGANSRVVVSASNLAVAVTNSLTTLLEVLSLSGIKRMWVEIKPTVHDLNAFAVQGKFHPSGDYVTLANATADYTVPSGVIFRASGDLTALAAAATGWLGLDVSGLHSLRIQASSASATGTLVDMYANASS